MADYIHGYSQEEQQRLIHQARFLKNHLHAGLDLAAVTTMLEVGCGVGAQTEILLNMYPGMKIVAVDVSQAQLRVAQERLREYVEVGRLEFILADARNLSGLGGRKFDGAFLCWFLEHVPDPLTSLREIRRYLQPDATIVINEVNNSSLFIHPYSAAFLKYWFEFNDLQWSIQGHPFVGLQMGNLLQQAGYKDIVLKPHSFFFDSRDLKNRREFTAFFFEILKSANDKLVKAGRVQPETILEVQKDFEVCADSPDGVFYFSWVRGSAIAGAPEF